MIAFSASEYAIYVESATAQIALGVVISSIVTPILARWEFKHTHPNA